MAKDEISKHDKHKPLHDELSKSDEDTNTESTMDSGDHHRHNSSKKKRKKQTLSSRHHRRSRHHSDDESGSDSESESESETDSDSESESESSESEEERRRRKRRERKKREERERKRRREKDKEKKKKRKGRDYDDDDDDDDERRRRKKKKKKERREKDKKREKGKKVGAVTESWGKFGIVREVDMWNKRPEFTAWLSEVKKVNLESLPNWEEKKMFREYMEDYNTATFPSKKYYDLDAYHRQKMEKEMKKGFKKVVPKERTVFDDEEQRRQELLQAREKQKEQEVEALKSAMKSGMAQAMKEQARLKEEMTYLFKIGNIEAATAIQRKLDPDIPM